VFTREDGNPLPPGTISRRFTALIERYARIRNRHAEGWSIDKIARHYRTTHEAVRTGIECGALPPIRFHELRHGAATLARAAGVDRKIVSQTLGHARVSFTDDVYGVVVPEMTKAAAEATATIVPRSQRR
jgi:integrase